MQVSVQWFNGDGSRAGAEKTTLEEITARCSDAHCVYHTTQWHAKPTAGHDVHGQSAVYGPDGKDIAIIYDGQAHANLIASAPDLLAALKLALGQLEGAKPLSGVHASSLRADLQIIRDAISKATQ